jgi:hypothetical protein
MYYQANGEIIPAPDDPDGGEIITKASWNLKKVK